MIEHRSICYRGIFGNKKGLTLVELLIAMALSFVVMTGVYRVYINQLKSANNQEKVVAMRQNWRAGHYVVGRELMEVLGVYYWRFVE